MTSDVSLSFGDKTFPGFYACPDGAGKFPGVIVIHEVWGLNDHTKDVANRLKDEGYCVLAPDLISHTGVHEKIDNNLLKEAQDPATRDEAQKKLRAAMAPIQSKEFGEETVAKLKICFDFLMAQSNCDGNIAVMGFCFGGTYSFALAAAEKDLKAAAVFYGHAPDPLDKVQTIHCPVMGFYGEQDANLVNGLPDLDKAMKQYGINFEYKVYPNTGHAFFNDTNPARYNKEAEEDSWQKVLAFFAKNLV